MSLFLSLPFDFLGQLLPFLMISPLISILFLYDVDDRKVKPISLILSIIIFLLSLFLYIYYDRSSLSELFQYQFSIKNFQFGVDGISISFIILSSFLIPICILSSWESITFRFKEFVILLFVIEFLLFAIFSTLDLILFYIFFEGTLIPMFIMIGVWGSRSRKILAAYQFFLFTFLGSVFMLLGILYIRSVAGSTNYLYLLTICFSPHIQIVLWLSFFSSFIVKIPMLPLHVWLPEAHVEASTAGSVLLAGIMLKLGGYGLIRFSLPLFPYATKYFTPFVLAISVISILYSSFTTLRQIDLKKLIAYTSIAHMNLVTIGIFSNSLNGLEGSISLMLSHGLVSSGLFLCVGILYDRYHTKNIKYYGGLTSLMPIFAIFFLVLSFSNMGMPGTSAFVGEFLILLGIFSSNTLSAFLATVSVVLSAAYSVFLYNRVMFGPIHPYIQRFSDLNNREFSYMALIILLVLFFGIYPNSFLGSIHADCSFLLQSSLDWNL